MFELNTTTLPEPALMARIVLDDSPSDISWSACGSWLAAATTSGVVHLVAAETGAELTTWKAHDNGALAVRWHPRLPLFASSGQDGHVKLWQVSHKEPGALLADITLSEDAGNNWIEHLDWRPDGAQLAASCGKKIILLTPDGSVQQTYTFPGGTVGALCWRPKGAQLAAAGYGGIRIYNVLDSRSKPQDLEWKGSLLSVKWSPDGRVIAAGCQDNTVHFWRMPELRDAMMSGFSYKPVQLSWSNNNRWLLTGGSTELILWPFDKKGPEGRKPLSLPYHPEAICAISIAGSGQRLATGCRAGIVALWNQIGDVTPTRAVPLDSRVEQLSWSPHKNTRLLASTSRYGTLSLWDVSS